MEENKPIHNEEEVKPPNNPKDAVHEQPLNTPSTDEPIVPATETTSEVEQPQSTNLKLKIWKYIITPTTLLHRITRKAGRVISGNF